MTIPYRYGLLSRVGGGIWPYDAAATDRNTIVKWGDIFAWGTPVRHGANSNRKLNFLEDKR